MERYGKVDNLLQEGIIPLEDIRGDVQPFPTLVSHESYDQNVLVYKVDTGPAALINQLQGLTDRVATQNRKEIWTWVVQWATSKHSTADTLNGRPIKKARISVQAPPATPSPRSIPMSFPTLPRPVEDSPLDGQHGLDDELLQEEDILRILIDIVQMPDKVVPNFIEFLYRIIDWYDGNGSALLCAIYDEIPSLWDFEYHPVDIPWCGRTKKTRPDWREFEKTMAASERVTERMQYHENRWGMQFPNQDITFADIPTLVNIPKDTRKRAQYYGACFKSRQRAVGLLLKAGISARQINNYRKLQPEHPKDTSEMGDNRGFACYRRNVRFAREQFNVDAIARRVQQRRSETIIMKRLQREIDEADRFLRTLEPEQLEAITGDSEYRSMDSAIVKFPQSLTLDPSFGLPSSRPNHHTRRLTESEKHRPKQLKKPTLRTSNPYTMSTVFVKKRKQRELPPDLLPAAMSRLKDLKPPAAGTPIMEQASLNETNVAPRPKTGSPIDASIASSPPPPPPPSTVPLGTGTIPTPNQAVQLYMSPLPPMRAQVQAAMISLHQNANPADVTGAAGPNAGQRPSPEVMAVLATRARMQQAPSGPDIRPAPLYYAGGIAGQVPPPLPPLHAGQPRATNVALPPRTPAEADITRAHLAARGFGQPQPAPTGVPVVSSIMRNLANSLPHRVPVLPSSPARSPNAANAANAPNTGHPVPTQAQVSAWLAQMSARPRGQYPNAVSTHTSRAPQVGHSINVLPGLSDAPSAAISPAMFTQLATVARTQHPTSISEHTAGFSGPSMPASPQPIRDTAAPDIIYTGSSSPQAARSFISPFGTHQPFSAPSTSAPSRRPAPLNLLPLRVGPSTPTLAHPSASPFLISPTGEISRIASPNTNGTPILAFFPRVLVPSGGDALLVGHLKPPGSRGPSGEDDSGSLVFERAVFLPVNLRTVFMGRVKAGKWTVLEAYSPLPHNLPRHSPSHIPENGKLNSHKVLYHRLHLAYSLLTEHALQQGQQRDCFVTKRWKVSPGLISQHGRGSIWEGYGKLIRERIFVSKAQRAGAVRAYNDKVDSERLREMDELLEMSDGEWEGMEE